MEALSPLVAELTSVRGQEEFYSRLVDLFSAVYDKLAVAEQAGKRYPVKKVYMCIQIDVRKVRRVRVYM